MLGLRLDDMQRLKGQDFIRQVFARPDRALNLIDEAARCGETVSDDLSCCITAISLAGFIA